jgi:hypothetical protein
MEAKMKPRELIKPALLLLTLFTFAACRDPIFQSIASEQSPKEARIKSPTNMVLFERKGVPALFVASGASLHWYAKTGGKAGWDNDAYKTEALKGVIRHLAATDTYLYALTDGGLKRIGKTDSEWTEIGPEDTKLQTVFAAGNKVFVSRLIRANDTSIYDILALNDGQTSLTISKPEGENLLLTGAVKYGENYYLSTRNGIYFSPSGADSWSLVPNSEKQFDAMIGLQTGEPVAIAHDGILYKVNYSGLLQLAAMDSPATSALALWQGSTSLLLAGRFGEVNSRGYRELAAGGGFNEPSHSVSDNSQYKSSIGKEHINYLLQVPAVIDSTMPLFAATANKGLYSCRNKVWNVEE